MPESAQEAKSEEPQGWRALGIVLRRIGRLKSFFLPYLPLAGGVALLVFFSADLNLLVTSIGQRLVNSFIGGTSAQVSVPDGGDSLAMVFGRGLGAVLNRSSVVGLIVAMAVMMLVVQALAIVIEQVRTRISLAFRTRLQRSLLAALLRDTGASRTKRDAGATRMIFAQDAGGLASFLIFGLLGFFEQGLRLILYSVGLWKMADGRGWILVVVFVPATVLIHLIVQTVFLRREMAASLANQQAMMANQSASVGFFNVMSRLVYLRGEAAPADKLIDDSRSAGEANRRYQLITSLKNSVSMILVTLSVPMIFLLATLLEMGSPGEVIQAQMVVTLLTAAVGSMMGFPSMLTQYGQPLKRVIEVLDVPEPGNAPAELTEFRKNGGPPALRVKDLAFSYPGSEARVIDGLSFEIESGQRVGIVGTSGSGKSTLARLLVGEWPADAGEIALDQICINGWHLWHRRELISYLPAEQGFLKASLEDNIIFGREHPGEKRLAEVISDCGLAEKREQLGDARLESVSEHLSTGEQRRVGVARMLCGDEPVRVFDEPIANLDRQNMVAVAEAIEKSSTGKTVLIITHDPEFFATDVNLFLVNGRLRAQGRHEDLLRDVPEYAELLQMVQQQRNELWKIEDKDKGEGAAP
jgi:ABC-type transport system involved in cytochrome bd biosynthesis fused ATPase/permease subunit